MLALVDEAEKVLVDKQSDLDEFGRLLDHTWRIKRKQVIQYLLIVLMNYMIKD